MPVHAAECVAGSEQNGPENIEKASFFPPLERAVYAAVVAKALRQLVPLTARSHLKEDAIEGFPGINAGASGGFGRILDREH